MVLQVRLLDSQVEDLSRVRDVSPASMSKLAERLNQLQGKLLRVDELRQIVTEEIPLLDDESVEALTRQALQIQGLARQRRVDVVDAVKAISTAVRLFEEPWLDEEFDRWDSVAESFCKVVDSTPVRMLSSVLDLSYDYANLFQSSRILTDIRPIFNQSGDAIDGAVVSYTLRLKYDSLDGDHSLSIALDTDDIELLLDNCRRALLKAKVAKNWIESQHESGVPALITGEHR